ncbi:MAG: cupredoxin domain-containing protein [Actinomycetota bacterium]|nr:cupredoxin domain-containing protein [Actinomycetota bacterium]
MITEPAKVVLSLTAVAAVAAVIYVVLTADHGGVTLYGGLAAVAFFAGVAVTVARDNEVAPAVAEDAGPPEFRPAPPVRLPGGPGWPALAGLAVGFIALGFLIGPLVAIPAGILASVAAVGWLASAAADRTRRVTNLLPLGIPVFGLFAIGSLMFLMSRILLAVPEQASTFIALAVAVLIMAVASFVALRPSISPRIVMAGLVIGGVLMTGGGLVAAAVGQRHVEEHHSGPEPVEIEATNVRFNLPEFELHADQEAVIDFHNDEAVPHNVAIYQTENFSGLALFQGAVIVGPESIEYRFRAPPAGTYYFRCDIHPTTMTGKVLVA